MLRIHAVHDSVLQADRQRVEQVQAIFRDNFAAVAPYADKIPELLRRPFDVGYRTILLTAEAGSGKVTGFSLFLYLPEIASGLLDFIAVSRGSSSSGLGGTLYEATREYLVGLRAGGLYMEVLPDDPDLVSDPTVLEENRKRLAFYEQYGARPIVNTAYETPVDEDPAAPYLLFDGLGRAKPLGRVEARTAVRLILRRKYAHLVSAGYIKRVAASFIDDPVQFRPLRYVRPEAVPEGVGRNRLEKRFAMVTSDHHRIHHVHERGYVERPARVDVLKEALGTTDLFEEIPVRHHGEDFIRKTHDGHFLAYLKAVCETITSDHPVYPYVFPVRRPERRPHDLALRAGYYCIDTFTPLDRNAYSAARSAVDVALTAAEELRQGRRVVYALCRPPGHHAGRKTFGGFCYFNNAAAAAAYLGLEGRVAMLDLDFHHGNGQQDIFYTSPDVFTVSIHGHPNHAYPYFSGFADELGDEAGRGFNRNYPLPESAGQDEYLEALEKAVTRVRGYQPVVLVVSLGFDTMKGDPTGSFNLTPRTLRTMGRTVASLDLPLLVVQEGGYSLRNLRSGSVAFFQGVRDGLIAIPRRGAAIARKSRALTQTKGKHS